LSIPNELDTLPPASPKEKEIEMLHQSGISLIEVLVTLVVLCFALLCLLGDGVTRQKKMRINLEKIHSFQQIENTHESTFYE
jgi:Tfp pilus assembly protein PilV